MRPAVVVEIPEFVEHGLDALFLSFQLNGGYYKLHSKLCRRYAGNQLVRATKPPDDAFRLQNLRRDSEVAG
jgi:hypothetical protein